MTEKAKEQKKDKLPILSPFMTSKNIFKERIGLGESFDLGIRKLKILRKEVHLYYINGLCDTQFIIEIIEQLLQINENERLSTNLFQIIENNLVHQSVSKIKTLDEIVDQVLSGLMVAVVEGEQTAFSIDVRSYPGGSRRNRIRRK